MKFICTTPMFFIILFGKFNLSKQTNDVTQGTYIVSANMIGNKGNVMSLIDCDSLFLYKHWVAEVKIKVETIEISGMELPRKNVLQGFYLINLQQESFSELKDLKNLEYLKYKPLSEKKNGFDFNGGKALFHNETYSVEKCIFEGEKARKISYTIKGGPYNNKPITIYVSDILNPNQPLILYPQMEKTFKGSIKEMRINLGDQGTLSIRQSFSQRVKKEYLDRLRHLSNIAG